MGMTSDRMRWMGWDDGRMWEDVAWHKTCLKGILSFREKERSCCIYMVCSLLVFSAPRPIIIWHISCNCLSVALASARCSRSWQSGPCCSCHHPCPPKLSRPSCPRSTQNRRHPLGPTLCRLWTWSSPRVSKWLKDNSSRAFEEVDHFSHFE